MAKLGQDSTIKTWLGSLRDMHMPSRASSARVPCLEQDALVHSPHDAHRLAPQLLNLVRVPIPVCLCTLQPWEVLGKPVARSQRILCQAVAVYTLQAAQPGCIFGAQVGTCLVG
eukprot:1155914-Pelagomonas_calceolata.AAC.3